MSEVLLDYRPIKDGGDLELAAAAVRALLKLDFETALEQPQLSLRALICVPCHHCFAVFSKRQKFRMRRIIRLERKVRYDP